jgi:Skp family chaperone for outer membrane proteins
LSVINEEESLFATST